MTIYISYECVRVYQFFVIFFKQEMAARKCRKVQKSTSIIFFRNLSVIFIFPDLSKRFPSSKVFHSMSLLNNNKQLIYLETKHQTHYLDADKEILKGCGRQLRNLLINHHKDQIKEYIDKGDQLKRKK